MIIRLILILVCLFSLPVWAGEPIQPVNDDEPHFDEPFERAEIKSALRSLLDQTLNVIDNHIEIEGSLQPNEQGERRLALKLYPQGKSGSDRHLNAELRFQSSPDRQHLSFDLKLPKESSAPPLPR